MFSQRRMDDAHIKEDLGRVGNLLEVLQGLVKLIVIVAA